MAELPQLAEGAGCRYMRWLVQRSNQSAITFYESIGAKVSDEIAVATLPVSAQTKSQVDE
jgi:ribosomal protein S18 acetylase RimI-like enzyme